MFQSSVTRISVGLSRVSSWLADRRFRPAWWLFESLAFVFLLYRCALIQQLVAPSNAEFSLPPAMALVASVFWDFLVAVLLSSPLMAAACLRPSSWRWAWVYMLPTIVTASFLSFLHLRLMVARGDTLGVSLVEDIQNGGGLNLSEMWEYGDPIDLVLFGVSCLVPLVVWFKWTLTSERWAKITRAAVLIFLSLGLFLPWTGRAPAALVHNPLQYAMATVVDAACVSSPIATEESGSVGGEGRFRMTWTDPIFVGPSRRATPRLGEVVPDKSWNVLFIVMESTGFQYVFQKASKENKKEVAMPFLRKLARSSWWMKNHHSTSNSSHRSLFSIYTGLYPSFGGKILATTDQLNVATLPELLDRQRDSFLVTAGSIETYFPTKLFQRTGLSDLLDRPAYAKQRGKGIPKVRADALMSRQFIKRVKTAKEPFFASYYSLTPHYPYMDHGKKYRIAPTDRDKKSRYLNCLRALDGVLEKVVEGLKESGRYDHTVLVIMGDHGEAFGQHGRSTHANDSHEEQLKTPWLVHVPGAPPFSTTELTSHVDIVPTVLDILQVDYDESLIQGESILRRERHRKYTFAVGNERAQVVYSMDGRKIIRNSRLNRCEAFDLHADRREKKPQDCDKQPEALRALKLFTSEQTAKLRSHTANRNSKERVRSGH